MTSNERIFVTDKFFEKVWYKSSLNTDKGLEVFFQKDEINRE